MINLHHFSMVMTWISAVSIQGPKRMWSERLKPYAARGQPHACSLCRERIKDKIGFEAKKVVHADLIPTMLGLRLFQAMPASVKGKAILAALSGKGGCLLLMLMVPSRSLCCLSAACRRSDLVACVPQVQTDY